jgi:hypothetical protein
MSLYEAGSYADQLGGSAGNDIYFDVPGAGPFVFNLPFSGGYHGVALTTDFISINGWTQGNCRTTRRRRRRSRTRPRPAMTPAS